MTALCTPLVLSCLAVAAAEPAPAPPTCPPPTPVVVLAPLPKVSLVLGPGDGTATPGKCGYSHAGAGNILVTHPAADTIVVTLTGAVIACGHPFKESSARYDFEASQCFEVVFNCPDVKSAKLVLEGRVLGVLRTSCHGCRGRGTAEITTPASATISACDQEVIGLHFPPRSACGGQDVSVYNREGPVSVPVLPGKYTLHQIFGIAASVPCSPLLCKGVSAEFAPDPAVDPNWLSHCWEPFHGAQKKDFGFQVTIKVVPD